MQPNEAYIAVISLHRDLRHHDTEMIQAWYFLQSKG